MVKSSTLLILCIACCCFSLVCGAAGGGGYYLWMDQQAGSVTSHESKIADELDQHGAKAFDRLGEVGCTDKPGTLSSLKIEPVGDKQVKYVFDCSTKVKTKGDPISKETEKATSDKSVHYFDRHTIDCEGNLLNAFQLHNTDDYSKFKFSYTCKKPSSDDIECETQETDAFEMNATTDLKNLNPKCKNGSIGYLRFRRVPDTNKFYYEYKCCAL